MRIQHAYSITNFRLGATNDKTGYDLSLYLVNACDIHGDVYIVASTAQPTMKYTNQPDRSGSM
jgi:hypothetical protein